MKKSTFCVKLFVLAIVFTICCRTPLLLAAAGENLVNPFTQVDTTAHMPGYPILKPLPDGPLKILFIGRRDHVGAMAAYTGARLDCQIESVLTEGRDRLGIPDDIFTPDDPLSVSVISSRLAKLLRHNWDVVWCDFTFGSFPENLCGAILDQVDSGVGMVYVGEMGDFKGRISGKRSDRPLDESGYAGLGEVQGIDYGDGRILVFPPLMSDMDNREAGDYLNAASYALYRSTKPAEGVVIPGVEIPRRRIEHEVVAISQYKVHLLNPGEPDSMTVVARFRSENGILAYENRETFHVGSGRSFVLMEYPPLTIGEYSLDISLFAGDKVRSFSGLEFLIETEHYISEIRVWDDTVTEGEFIIGTVRHSFVLPEGISVTATVFDSQRKAIDFFDVDLVPGRRSVDFSYKVKTGLDRAISLEFHLFKNNEMVHKYEVPVLIERKPEHKTFSLGVVENPDDSILPLYARIQRYKTLVEGGVDIIAPCFLSSGSAGTAYDHVFDLALAGAQILPILSLTPNNGPDTGLMTALVDTLIESPVHSFGIVDLSGGGSCPDDSFIRGVNALSSVLGAAGNDAGYTVIGAPSPFACGSVRQEMPDNKLVGGGLSYPVLTESGPGMDMLTAAILAANPDSAGNRGFFVNGLPDWASGTDECTVLPWRALFSGANNIWWNPMNSGASAALTPQGTMSPAFRALAVEADEIATGIDRLVYGCTRETDEIAIIHDDELPGKSYDSFKSTTSILMACTDLGYTPVLLSVSETESLISADPSYRVAFVPAGITLAEEHVAYLASFMDNGGTVIAETIPRAKDAGHQDRVDTLFGIAGQEQITSPQEASAEFMTTEAGAAAGITGDMIPAIPGVADQLLVRDEAQVFAVIRDVPVLVEHKGMNGAGILLNYRYPEYEPIRFESAGAAFRNLMTWCLRRSGIDQAEIVAETVDPKGAGIDVSRFDDGTGEYIGLIRTSQGPDTGTGSDRLVRMNVTLPGKTRFAYDVRRGTYLGARESFPLELPPGQATVVAFLPYRVRGMDISLERAVVEPGGDLVLRAELLLRDRKATPGRHMFRMQIFDPDGNIVLRNVLVEEAPEGRLDISVRVPVDELPGQWSVSLQDVATGIRAVRTFHIKRQRKMEIPY